MRPGEPERQKGGSTVNKHVMTILKAVAVAVAEALVREALTGTRRSSSWRG